MAAASATPYLQVGPRQGMYCRPSVLLTAMPSGGYQQQYLSGSMETGGGHLKWRLSQFKSPDHSYRLRARVDNEEPPHNIPQIPGRIIERPTSAKHSQQLGNSRPPAHKLQMSRSSSNLQISSYNQQLSRQQTGAKSTLQTTNGSCLIDRHRKSNTAPVFSIQACAVTIQSRPFARSSTTPKKIAQPEEPFPYPDPIHVGGDHAFNVRLVELAGLQRDTIKSEECRARIARRNAAAMMSSSNSTCSVQQQQHTTVRQPIRPSSGHTRSSVPNRNIPNRRISLPVSPTVKKTVIQEPSPVPQSEACSVASKEPPETSSVLPTQLKNHSNLENDDPSEPTFSVNDILATDKVDNDSGIGAEMNELKIDEEVENTCVIQKVVPAKSHHRELVNAIFSREKQTHNEVTAVDDSAVKTKEDGVVSHSSEDDTIGSQSPSKSTTTKHHSKAHSKSRSSSSTPTPALPQEPLSPNILMIPPNEISPPHSSASSSSITSEHSPSSQAHAKKSRIKSAKSKRHPKKHAVKHKHT